MCDRVDNKKRRIVADKNIEKFLNDKGGLEEAFKAYVLSGKRAWCSFRSTGSWYDVKTVLERQ